MTLSEFKAWFEGFTEDMDGAPSVRQFDKIKAKVSEIDDKPIEKTVFIDRYHDYFPPRFWTQPYVSYSAGAVQGGDAVGRAVLSSPPEMTTSQVKANLENKETWDSALAMRELGRAEAAA